MPPSGEEIQAALRAFAARWRDYDGGERQGAQTFLNELAECYGTDLIAEGVKAAVRLAESVDYS